jgi:hypothetical protein
MLDIAQVAFRWATAMVKQFPIMSSIVVLLAIIMIVMITYMMTHVITGIPIAVSRVQQQYFSDYVGFPIDKPELDAQSISYGEITITNISADEKVAIDIMLHITGPDGTNIKTRADLTGPFGMILERMIRKQKIPQIHHLVRHRNILERL